MCAAARCDGDAGKEHLVRGAGFAGRQVGKTMGFLKATKAKMMANRRDDVRGVSGTVRKFCGFLCATSARGVYTVSAACCVCDTVTLTPEFQYLFVCVCVSFVR